MIYVNLQGNSKKTRIYFVLSAICAIFASSMNNNLQEARWSENVILVDADYVDQVAFNLIVNFERMIGRPIPQADFARWIDCIALDGGIRQRQQVDGQNSGMGEQDTQVVLIHKKDKTKMDNFLPGDFATELNGKAFKDHLGEFSINSYPIEDIAGGENFLQDALQLATEQKEVKRIMVIPNAEDTYIYNKVREILNRLKDDQKRITVFAMQPMPGGNFRQEILGFSLMAALGIQANEINPES